MAEEKGVWRTVAGRRIFIADGDSLSDAMKKSGKFKGNSSNIAKNFSDNDERYDKETKKYKENNTPEKAVQDYKDAFGYETPEEYVKDRFGGYSKKFQEDRIKEIKDGLNKKKFSKEEKMAAIKEAYEKQQSFKDTTYEVMEKDGKYRVVGGNNNGSDDPGSWHSKKRDYLERGYKELPDSDYKEFMNSLKEKKFDNGRTEKIYDSKKEKKSAYGRDAVKLNDLQKEVANFSKDLDQDKWAKQMREDYVKQVYYTHARELKPVPHKGSDGKEYVYGNDSKNEYRIETSYLSSALRGDLAGWYNNATRVNSRAPREWQLKVDKLVKDKFVNTYGTWEDYQASKKKKK